MVVLQHEAFFFLSEGTNGEPNRDQSQAERSKAGAPRHYLKTGTYICLTRALRKNWDISLIWSKVSGHRDTASKTGTVRGKPGHLVTLNTGDEVRPGLYRMPLVDTCQQLHRGGETSHGSAAIRELLSYAGIRNAVPAM